MINQLRFLIQLLNPKRVKTLYVYTVLSVISPLVDLVSVYMIVPILSEMTGGEGVSLQLILFTCALGAVMILKGCMELFRCNISNQFVYYSAQELSVRVYELFLREDLLKHNERTEMQELAAVRTDTANCINILVSAISIGINAVAFAAYAVTMIYLTSAVGFFTILLLFVFMFLMYYRNRIHFIRYGNERRRLEIRTNAQVSMAYGSYKEMKIGDRADDLLKEYDACSKEYTRVQSKYLYRSSMVSVIMQNSLQAALFFGLALIMILQVDLLSLLAQAVLYITILLRTIPLSSSIVNQINSIEFSQKSYEVMQNCYAEYEEQKQKEEKEKGLRKKEVTFQKGISVKNLTFGYRAGCDILKNVSLEIPAGHTIAITGASGAGKTTLVDLILGLLVPREGSIFYDDYDIVSQKDGDGACKGYIGNIVSYIPQIVYLNGETVKNNVTFLSDREKADQEKVITCLKCAQIWEDVEKMPQGMDTLIGENGLAISGGQRQRIAVARALYKEFEFLIMDEATAALDAETEKAVIASVRQLKKDKTLLIVTHHMSLVDECDMVYQVEDQKVVRVR